MAGQGKKPAAPKHKGSSASRDRSPSRESSKKSKKEKHKEKKEKHKEKKEKRKEKEAKPTKKPVSTEDFSKRFMPFSGDRDYEVRIVWEGSGEAPPHDALKSNEITRLMIVPKNGDREFAMLAVKNAKDERWEFLTKQQQTKIIQAGVFKTHLGTPITRAMIGAWNNRWPACDPNADEYEQKISEALKDMPIVSDTFAASMTQFASKGIKFVDIGKERVLWSDVRKKKSDEYPRPGDTAPEKENADPSSENSLSDNFSEDEMEVDEQSDEEESEPKKEAVAPAEKPVKTTLDFRKPFLGPERSDMQDGGNGLRGLRDLGSMSKKTKPPSAEEINNTLQEGSLRPAIGMHTPTVDGDDPAKKEPKSASPKRPAKKVPEPKKRDASPKRKIVEKKEPAPKRQKPAVTVQTKEGNITLDQSHWTAKRVMQGYEYLETYGKLEARLNADLLEDLGKPKTLEQWLADYPEDHPIRRTALGLLLELRLLSKKEAIPSVIENPISYMVSEFSPDRDPHTVESVKAIVKELSSAILYECEVPETKAAPLVEHFKDGVLDSHVRSPLWRTLFMNPKKSTVNHTIGSMSEEQIELYRKSMTESDQNNMFTILHAWKGAAAPAPPPPDDDFVF